MMTSAPNTPDDDMLDQNRLDSHLNLMENDNVAYRTRCVTIELPADNRQITKR